MVQGRTRRHTCSLGIKILNCEIQSESIALNMKQIIILFACIFLSLGAQGQTVENIRVEQDGENILVHFRIGGSTDAQTFKVKLSCSIDGGRQFDPLTVIGDVGENIRGGKSNYTITWDVFEDLDEIGEVEFFVSVDLTSDLAVDLNRTNTSHSAPTKKEYSGMDFLLAYTGSTLGPYGLSTGIIYNKWGGYFSFRFGADDPGSVYYTDWRIYVAGVLRQVVESGKYKLFAYVGGGAVNEYYEDYGTGAYSDYTTAIFDGGIVNVFGKVSLTLGVEYINSDWVQPVFGIGYMFPIKRKAKL